VKHRALARAGWAEKSDDLALLDPQIEPPQRNGLRRARPVDLEDVVEFERAERDLLAPVGLAVEARYLQRKLSIISR
jgi:hypothetical protein